MPSTEASHALMVRTLAKNPHQILRELTPSNMNILHAVVGISGEAGELLDAVKKACIYNKVLDLSNVIEELGDLEFYTEQLRQEIRVTREECLKANMEKLAIRYEGMKFSNEAAQKRADKETMRLADVSDPTQMAASEHAEVLREELKAAGVLK